MPKNGFGGGRASDLAENSEFALAFPCDLTWPPTPEAWECLRDYLEKLAFSDRQLSEGANPLRNIPNQRLVGRFAGTDGTPQFIEIGSNLTLSSGGVLSATAGGGAGPAAGATEITLAELALDLADIQSLGTVPQEIVAAPASGFVHIPLWMQHHQFNAAGSGYSTSRGISIRYQGSTTPLTQEATQLQNGANQTRIGMADRSDSWAFDVSTFDPRAKALMVASSGNVTGGEATNTLSIRIGYVTIEVP